MRSLWSATVLMTHEHIDGSLMLLKPAGLLLELVRQEGRNAMRAGSADVDGGCVGGACRCRVISLSSSESSSCVFVLPFLAMARSGRGKRGGDRKLRAGVTRGARVDGSGLRVRVERRVVESP